MNRARLIEDFLSATSFQNPIEVSVDTQLEDLPEWDPLVTLGVIVMFDMEYGKTITGEDLIKARTVSDLYQMPRLRP